MNPYINTLPIPNADQPAHVDGKVNPQSGVDSDQKAPEIGAQPSLADSQNVAAAAGSGSVSRPSTNVPSAAEKDTDFEKKWVVVAKTIIARTKYDPYLQSRELSRAGREYRKALQRRG